MLGIALEAPCLWTIYLECIALEVPLVLVIYIVKMVSNYKKKGKCKEYTEDDKVRALEALHSGLMTFKQISQDLGIPTSTLNRWKQNPHMVLGSGKTCVFSPTEEELMVVAIEYCARCGFPITREMLKDMVHTFVSSSGKRTPFRGDKPGDAWVLSFERRHRDRISRRKREGISKARAHALSPRNVNGFFDDVYKPIYDKHGLEVKPWLIWNVDETGFQSCRATRKVYVGKNQRNAYSREGNSTKTSFTVLACGNAAGQYLPPFTVYKGKGLRNTWTYGGPPDAGYSYSDHGWMMDINFEAWFRDVFIPQTQARAPCQPHVLVFDGHNSHLTYTTVLNAMNNNIDIICLPPSTSHALQPLDVGFFKAVKGLWSKHVLSWYDANGGNQNVNKESFPGLLKAIWDDLDPAYIINGFRGAGLHPLDKEKVKDKILVDPNDRVPVLPRPRSPENILINSINETLKGKVTAPAAKKGPTKRVQAEQGEVLTCKTVLKRLQDHEAEMAAKKQKRGSGVSITMRAPGNNANTVQSNNLDNFVIRTPRTNEEMRQVDEPRTPDPITPEDEIQVEESHVSIQPVQEDNTLNSIEANILVHRTMEDDLSTPGPSGVQRRRSSEDGFYREQSSSDNIDPDDPNNKEVSERPKVLYKSLKTNCTHLIILYEGQHFPGMVTQKHGDGKTITVKVMRKLQLTPAFWTWPKPEEYRTIEMCDVVQRIPTPKMNSSSRETYFVKDIAQFWPNRYAKK